MDRGVRAVIGCQTKKNNDDFFRAGVRETLLTIGHKSLPEQIAEHYHKLILSFRSWSPGIEIIRLQL